MENIISVGESCTTNKTITEQSINAFAEVSGDKNRLHIDNNNVFGKRIAHGMLTASFISKVIGMDFPGEGTVYLEQNCKFIKPVFIGDTITINICVVEIIKKEKGIIKLSNVVNNQNGEIVLEGFSVIKLPSNYMIKE